MGSLSELTEVEAVRAAAAECDRLGVDRFLDVHGFRPARTYILRLNGREYPSKAIAAVAYGYQFPARGPLSASECSGGEAPGRAAHVLRSLGFEVSGDELMEDEERIEEERHYREAIAAKLAGLGREPTPADLAELGVRPMRTGQGIFRDHDRTRAIAPPHGVTLSLLDVGGVYADAFDEDGGIYHYPTTGRGERDVAEIEATKNACRLELPVFVVLAGQAPDTRDVRVGHVERWDDESRTCFIGFGRRSGSLATSDDAPFELEGPNRSRVQATRSARPGQNRFRFEVLLRYGSACAFCGLRCEALLDAIHLRPVEAKGCDDPRNGLPACPTHHRAFDLGLIWIHPETLAVESGRDARDLGVRLASIQHLPALPHVDALRWAFERVKGRKGTS